MNEKVFTWNDYKSFVTDLLKQTDSIYCRGQVDPTWRLRTSFHRAAENSGITLIQYLDKLLPEVHYNITVSAEH